MVVPLMLGGRLLYTEGFEKLLYRFHAVPVARWKETLENIFFHVQENSCQSAAAVHNNLRSYQTMCARGGIGRRARFRF